MCDGSLSILKKLCNHSYAPDFTVGTEVTELRNLNAIGVIGSQGGRSQIIAPIDKVKVGMVAVKWTGESKQQSPRGNFNCSCYTRCGFIA